MKSLYIPVVLCIVTLAGCSAVTTSGTKPGADPARVQAANRTNTVWNGVYRLVQAESGEALYGRRCAWCHGRLLEGNEDFCGPPLAGPEFWRRWRGQSVGAFYDRIRKTMPENQAGSLSDQEYTAVVSFILKANELPAGQKDLPSELPTLGRIIMTNQSPKR